MTNETLEQAVKRIATTLHGDLGDSLSVSQEYWRLEAALREMAAFQRERDAGIAESLKTGNHWQNDKVRDEVAAAIRKGDQ